MKTYKAYGEAWQDWRDGELKTGEPFRAYGDTIAKITEQKGLQIFKYFFKWLNG